MEKTNILLSSIEESIKEIRRGNIIIVIDDENRENEGNFIIAAEKVTSEIINFFITYGKGLVCVPLTKKRCNFLNLPLMMTNNIDSNNTAFTISVDLHGHGVKNGISTLDRAKTIQALVNPKISSELFNKPGHVFPLCSKEGGVLVRPGHTEAAIDLTQMAGCVPGAVIVEILNENGDIACFSELVQISKKFQLKIISITDLITYRIKKQKL